MSQKIGYELKKFSAYWDLGLDSKLLKRDSTFPKPCQMTYIVKKK